MVQFCMKITRPRAMDFLVLATGFLSFWASCLLSLAGASPQASQHTAAG